MGDMKRFALAVGVLGVVCFSAFASGTAQAQVRPRPQPSYPPGSTLTLVADPDEVAPNGTFDAVLTGCFPGETVTFYNLWPSQTAQDICDATTYTASVPFNATTTTGTRYIVAYIPALNSPDPEVPDFPPRFLVATYQVRANLALIATPGAGGGGTGSSTVSTSSSTDSWPSFAASWAIVRTFLALLALIAGIFFVLFWRRRREDEEQNRVYGASAIPPPDPSTPSLA